MSIFCPNFNNLAKTKLVFHCNGPNFAQKHFVQRSWRVPFFFFFFFYLVSSQPATRVRATDALRTVLVITTTLTLPAYHMHKRTTTERMVRFSSLQWFFNFPGVSQSLCCDTGIVYCPWILCIDYMQLVPLCTKIMAGSFFSFFFFSYLYVMSNTLYKDHGVFLFLFFSILYHHSQQPVSELPMPWGQCLLSQRHSLYLRITCTRGQQQKEWWDFLHNSDFSIFLVLVSHYAVIRVLFTVLESFVLQHLLKSYTSRVNKTL